MPKRWLLVPTLTDGAHTKAAAADSSAPPTGLPAAGRPRKRTRPWTVTASPGDRPPPWTDERLAARAPDGVPADAAARRSRKP